MYNITLKKWSFEFFLLYLQNITYLIYKPNNFFLTMTKNVFKMAMALAMLFVTTQPANAQLGKLLKKIGNTVEAVADNKGDTRSGNEYDNKILPSEFVISSTTSTSGSVVTNPFSKAVDIQLVGAYGKSTSDSYGTVSLVLKVMMKDNKSRISFGGRGQFPGSDVASNTMCIDQNGELYCSDSQTTSESYDVSEGVYVKLKLESPYNLFINVKKTARVLQVIKLGLYIDANTTGYITMKNVPILWDVKP